MTAVRGVMTRVGVSAGRTSRRCTRPCPQRIESQVASKSGTLSINKRS